MGIYRARGGADDWVVTGSGSGTTDNAAVAAAVARINAAGHGGLILEGDVRLTGSHTFVDVAARVRGMNGRARVLYSGSDSLFVWTRTGELPSAPSAGHATIAATAGNDFFTTSAFTPTPGSVVCIYSNDVLPVLPHFGTAAGAANCPGEIHRVQRWDVSTQKAYVEGPIADTMATSARGFTLPTLLENAELSDLTFEYVGNAQNEDVYTAFFWGCNSPTVRNVHILRAGTGGIGFRWCMNVLVTDLVIEGQWLTEGVYGVVVAMCNGVLLNKFQITGTRHAFTTSSGMSSGNIRYGTPLNVQVANGQIHNPIKYALAWDVGTNYGYSYSSPVYVVHNGSLWKSVSDPPLGAEPGVHASWASQSVTRIPLDTHAEGYGVTFRNVEVNIGTGGAYGGNARARRTRYLDCTFRGNATNSAEVGVLVNAPDTQIIGCLFENVWCPVQQSVLHGEWRPLTVYAANSSVEYNGAVYRANSGAAAGAVPGVSPSWTLFATDAVRKSWQSGTVVVGNTFLNCRGQGARLDTGNNHLVAKNTFRQCGRLDGLSPLYSSSVVGIREGTGHLIADNLVERDLTGSGQRASFDIADLPTSAVRIAGNTLAGFGALLDPTAATCRIGRLLDWIVPDHTAETFEHTAHGLAAGDWGYLVPTYGGTLPGGFVSSTIYYVVLDGVADPTNKFKLSLSYGGPPISFTDNGVYEHATTGAYVLLFRAVTQSLDLIYANANNLLV